VTEPVDSPAPARHPHTPPPFERFATFWTLHHPGGSDLVCSAYRLVTGLELRAEYSGGNAVATELFHGPEAPEQLANKAEAWRVRLLEKGFRKIAR
jgi:hypothetical protein